MKTAIVYYSQHHGNTKKHIDAIAAKYEVDLIDAAQTGSASLEAYDWIGFASGIYYSKFHKSVLQLAEQNLPENKEVFFLYTYGAKKDGYTKSIAEIVKKKSARILGEFGCPGLDTFGPFKLVGGIAKGHPNQQDCEDAVRFYGSLSSET